MRVPDIELERERVFRLLTSEADTKLRAPILGEAITLIVSPTWGNTIRSDLVSPQQDPTQGEVVRTTWRYDVDYDLVLAAVDPSALARLVAAGPTIERMEGVVPCAVWSKTVSRARQLRIAPQIAPRGWASTDGTGFEVRFVGLQLDATIGWRNDPPAEWVELETFARGVALLVEEAIASRSNK